MAREHSEVNLCVKYALFLENFALWLLSLIVTALSIYILVIKEKKIHDAIDFFFDPSTLLCTAGAITMITTLFGWLGALREYTSCLRLYNWILTVIFLLEIVAVVLIFVFYFAPDAKKSLGLFPEKTFKQAIKKYGLVEDDDMKNLIDNMQESLECCGFSETDEGFLDWNDNEYYKCNNETQNNPESCSVPASCCKLKPGDMKNVLCGRKVMTSSNTGDGTPKASSEATGQIYTQGCLKAVGTFINDHAMLLGGVMLGVLIPQMYFMYLSRTLREQILAQKAKWR